MIGVGDGGSCGCLSGSPVAQLWFCREDAELGDFVSSLAHRIARFPAAGQVVVKDRVNAIALAPVDDFRRDSELFLEGVRTPESQGLIQAAMKRGFQTRGAEMDLARLVGDLADR